MNTLPSVTPPERCRIELPSGLEILPTGAPLAVDVPGGSVVTFPGWWSRLDCLGALARMGVGPVYWFTQTSAEVVP